MAESTSFKSVVELWHHRTSSTPDADAMYGRRRDGSWYTMTWKDAGVTARKIACGLHALGLEKGQRCAILSVTRPEWVLVDMGILAAGGATTTIYPSNTPEECQYILEDSDTVFCFAEDQSQVDKLLDQREHLPGVKHVIVIDGRGTDDGWVVSLSELERQGAAWDKEHEGGYERSADAVGPDDIATLIYTSGTTGKPKGVILSHDCWVFESEAMDKLGLLGPSDKQYLFLPLAHSFAKVLECGFIRAGTPTVVDGDLGGLVPNLSATSPTVMGAVPRIFEKVYNKVVGGAKDAGGLKYRIFRWAVEVGGVVSTLRQQGKEPSGLLAVKHRLADRLVYSKLKTTFGGRIKYFISGGAPLAKEIAEFFHAADILVLEGYGLTESSAASFVNRPERYKFGTVGLPLPGVKVKIAEDGEILLGGRGIMKGYYKREEDTKEALTDGWLHTGDIGELDADGFLRITDRKKDIIVTAGGKNIAPQVIENALKARSQYVSQVVMHGDKRNFCVALITINEESVGKWAGDNGISYTDYADLAAKQEVHDLIWKDVQALNEELARYETIKYIHLLDHDLSQETGELTPKMSVKRRVVERKYQDVLDGFYKDTLQQM
ncbi:MAG: long-chain fatty acid--CoA ligase [Alphaproteobacteria bacterium]|nr:long-chain fatty acid--CoA ligase [Alphaproteobacteria bacterium]